MSKTEQNLLSMEEAIVVLKTSRPTFYRWLRDGRLKGMKIGRQWRFYKEDLERFLQGDRPLISLPTTISPLIEDLKNRLEEYQIESPFDDKEEIEQLVLLISLLAIAIKSSEPKPTLVITLSLLSLKCYRFYIRNFPKSFLMLDL